MKKIDPNSLPSALVAADVCVFRIVNGELCVYVTHVKYNPPYLGMSCLPGSLIYLHENGEDTVKRVLEERTTLSPKDVYVEQLASFSDVKRDKRSRSVAIAYLGLMNIGDSYGDLGPDLGSFVPLKKVKTLAFDHKEIIQTAYERLSGKLLYSTIVKKLIHNDFTFAELQKVYEAVLGRDLDKRNFRKKITALNMIVETNKYKKEGRMRPAMLYKWRTNRVEFHDVFGFGVTK
jgi:8-oxo-dGTP diphosphatase